MNVFIYIILFLSALVNVTAVSTQKSTPFGVPSRFGGDKRDRTADLLNAMASGGGQNEYIWIKWTK